MPHNISFYETKIRMAVTGCLLKWTLHAVFAEPKPKKAAAPKRKKAFDDSDSDDYAPKKKSAAAKKVAYLVLRIVSYLIT